MVRGSAVGDEQLAQVRVVDLSAVTSFDRAALTLVVRCVQHARDGVEGRLRLVGASAHVREDLALLGVLELVDLHDSR
ncbi:STAS domain-containing protein [uncultured Pseudokineococcus sp.]|uniref:STAS domain-containing protein n=1 Tax=uncultured Pseudokineococcus sp. TaxID=1642928 RepID=UPI002606C026|nr:STAS domain-containing protein [uncultured Pseudokineococcus sp.]